MADFDVDEDFGPDDRPSKSARKREVEYLQTLGERLATLSPEVLRRFDLPERLFNALLEIKRLKAREAIRRQRQFIGKLMRDADIDSIDRNLNELDARHTQQTARFRRAEKWRDLLQGGDPLDDLLDRLGAQYPQIHRAELAQLCLMARQDREDGVNRGRSKRLFRYLYDRLL